MPSCCCSEAMWPVEARNAAIANHCFTCAINRVGTVSRALGMGNLPPGSEARELTSRMSRPGCKQWGGGGGLHARVVQGNCGQPHRARSPPAVSGKLPVPLGWGALAIL